MLQLLVSKTEEGTQTGGGVIGIQVQGDNSQVDDQYHVSRLQAALLTFIAVIHVEELLVQPKIFSAVQSVARAHQFGFIGLLNVIVERNSRACTIDGLHIVKATSALLVSMLRHNVQEHDEQTRQLEIIIASLSKATKKLSDLENWTIFQNTCHHVVQNHLWLLPHLVKDAQNLLNRDEQPNGHLE